MIVVRRFWLSWPLLFLLDIIHPSYHPDSLTSTDYSKSSTFVDPLIRLDEPFFPPLSPGSLSLLRPVSGLGPDLASSSHASPYNYPNGSNTSTSTVTAPNRSTATITAAPHKPPRVQLRWSAERDVREWSTNLRFKLVFSYGVEAAYSTYDAKREAIVRTALVGDK